MKKHVVLLLEYDMGDYSEMEEEGGLITADLETWKEIFYQSDIFTCDMEVLHARVEDRE